MANPDIPLCDLALLNWVSHRVPSSPAIIQDPKREVLHLYYTDHTHTHPRTHAHTQTFKEERDVLDLGLKYNYYVKALEKIACSDRPQKKS